MKDRDILRNYCKIMFYIGSGNCWYKEDEIGNDRSLLYRAFGASLIFLYGSMTILEIMAFTIGNFPVEEKRECLSFASSHVVVMLKIFLFIFNKPLIKGLNHKIVSICEDYDDSALMAKKYKTMKRNVISYFAIVYGTTLFYIAGGLRNMFRGSHFVTVVTYYPSFDDNSPLANFVRVLNTIILSMMMLTMIISLDSCIVMYLIMYRYKFMTLRKYFENLREEFFALINRQEVEMATEKMANGLVEGIKMHSSLIRLKPEIDQAFATFMALQVFESSGVAVCLLLQIALSDEHVPLVVTIKIVFFVFALFFLLGLCLCNAGDITHEASKLSNAIFYCGWQSCPPRCKSAPKRNIRKLVLLAIMQAQRPPVMKAFKMLELNYATFIQVVRTTYSVSALFYAQNK
uniref:Odorant receptor n=1 Tax=Helicoverpa armigera TaxID=29058 RepID=A0A7T3N0J7_HELAM|nr:odorant receptor [Helicoverpa armigera]